MKYINRRTVLLILTVIFALFLICVYAFGIFLPDSYLDSRFAEAKLPPSAKHIFGTDALGRDLFLRTLKGLSVSITVGIAASAVSAIIAVVMGAAAAAGSKRLDAVVNWLIDLSMSVPHTVVVILISFVLGKGFSGLMIGIAATHWCSLARLIRGEVLQLRSRHYIAVSQKLGKSGLWIVANHFLPHILPQLLVGLILAFPHAVLHEASVSFLGFGLSPEQPSVGIILSESMRYISTGMWWQAVLPGITLVIIVLLTDRIGENLRTILDPYSAQS